MSYTILTLRLFQCGTLRYALFVEHWSKTHMYLKDTDFALLCTQIFINPITVRIKIKVVRGFDKNVFQIFLLNIYRNAF
jgi:hypothetical protein